MTLSYFNPVAHLGPTPGFPFQAPAVFFEDFIAVQNSQFSTTENTGVWQVGGTNAAVVADTNIGHVEVVAAAGTVAGAVTFTTTGTSGDDLYAQLNGTAFLCTAGVPLFMQVRWRPDTITTVVNHFGLYAADAVGATTVNPNDTQPVGFGLIYSSGTAQYQVKSAAGTTAPAALGPTITASTTGGWVTSTMVWTGVNTLQFFHNGTLYKTVTANIPTGIYLSPVFGLSTASTATKAMTVDYIWVSSGALSRS